MKKSYRSKAVMMGSVCVSTLALATTASAQMVVSNAGQLTVDLDGQSALGWPAGNNIKLLNTESGKILIRGDKSTGLYIHGAGSAGATVFVENRGEIESIAGAPGNSHQHGIIVGGSAAAGDGGVGIKTSVDITHTGHITTHTGSSRGIYVQREQGDFDPPETVRVDASGGSIKTLFDGPSNNTSDGIYVNAGNADVEVIAGDIEVHGWGMGVAVVTDRTADVISTEGTEIRTFDAYSHGIYTIALDSSDVNVMGTIITSGDGSAGVESEVFALPPGLGSGDSSVTVGEDARIEAAGASAAGIRSASTGAASVDNAGKVVASGHDGVGLDIGTAGSTYTIHNSGLVDGGWGDAGAAINAFAASGEIINSGELTSRSDRLVASVPADDMDPSIESGNLTLSNTGTMTGYVTLGSLGGNQFTNDNVFVVRNFADTNGDGERDTRGVAINDLGGEDSHFVNDANGVLTLGAADGDDYDATGYYVAGTGLDNDTISPDIYDFSRAGLLQGQFINTNSFVNRGLIDLTGSEIGNTLIITSSADAETVGSGKFVADGGELRLGVVLNDGDGGAGSQADMLIADQIELGDNGPVTIHAEISDASSPAHTAGNGIQLVQVRDADSSAAGAFSLAGNYVHDGAQAIIGGAYAYKLYQNGISEDDGNWYLRSALADGEPLYNPGVPVYEVYPQHLLGLNGLPTLQQRVGNRFWSGPGVDMAATPDTTEPFTEGKGVWGRIEGSHTSINPATSTTSARHDQDVLRLQAGVDMLVSEQDDGDLIGGLTMHYARGWSDIASPHGHGKISTKGYGLGGTLTWYDDDGFYVDGQGQVSWYKSDLNSKTMGQALVSGNKGFGYALSAETGKRMPLDNGMTLTPQAQLVYSNIDFDDFTDPLSDMTVSRRAGDSLRGRLGVSLDRERSWTADDGTMSRDHFYGIANLHYEFLGKSEVSVAGVSFHNRPERLWGEVGLGGSYNWNDDKNSLFGEVSITTALSDYSNNHGVKGTAGLRIRW